MRALIALCTWVAAIWGRTCDVTLCCGELVEQLILQLLQLDGELCVLDDELGLGLLQVGPLLVHHQRQQLVLQALQHIAQVQSGC